MRVKPDVRQLAQSLALALLQLDPMAAVEVTAYLAGSSLERLDPLARPMVAQSLTSAVLGVAAADALAAIEPAGRA